MKINTTQIVTQLNDEPFKDSKQKCPTCSQNVGKTETLTLRLAMLAALRHRAQNEQMNWEQISKRFDLLKRVHNAKETVDLEPNEVMEIRELFAQIYNPECAGVAGLMLDT